MNENVNNEVVNENNTTSNANQIFDLIQSIQSKLNNENNLETNNNIAESDDSNNIETDNNIHTDYDENIDTNNNNNTFDFSSLLKNIDIGSVLNTFSNLSQNNSNNTINNDTVSNNNFNLGGIDPSMLLKFGNMFSSATRDNPKRNLLLSLKPFLRKTRQDKLNEYITILTIVDAIGIFNSKGSGK